MSIQEIYMIVMVFVACLVSNAVSTSKSVSYIFYIRYKNLLRFLFRCICIFACSFLYNDWKMLSVL